MPRNSSGNYTLPSGNPVVADTLIETAWANPTMSDIASALTDSLDRNGRGGMLAPFRIADGTVTQPGLAFTAESNTGLWRSATATLAISTGGVKVASFQQGAITFNAASTFNGPQPQISIDVLAGSQQAILQGMKAGVARWLIAMPDSAAETGSNGGSNFGIYRYSDAGVSLGVPALALARSNGAATFASAVTTGGQLVVPTGGASIAGGVTVSSGGATITGTTTVNGSLAVSLTSGPQVGLYAAAGANVAGIASYKNSVPRWQLVMGDSAAESGSNAGSNFYVYRFSDAGSFVDAPIMVNRANGSVTVGIQQTFIGTDGTMSLENLGTTRSLRLSGNNRMSLDTGTLRCSWYNTSNTLIYSVDLGGGGVYSYFGTAYKPGGGSWVDVSDASIKQNVRDYDGGLNEVLQLRPRIFNFTPETGRDPTEDFIGLLAQEVEAVMPEMVGTLKVDHTEGEPFAHVPADTLLTLDASALQYALVNAVQELAANVESLAVRVTNIEGAL